MKRWIPLSICFAVLALGVSIASGQGASPRAGAVFIPDSNAQRPGDIGVRSHTNYLIFVPARKPDFNTPQGETPGSIACIYHLVSPTAGCSTSSATTVPSGGSSAATPALAGIVNLLGTAPTSTQDELTAIYGTYHSSSYSSDFTDITTGSTSSCDFNPHRPAYSACQNADTGWDFMSGVGSNLGASGK